MAGRQLTWFHVFLIVTGCALAGMLLGAAFGYGAGSIAPRFFKHMYPWHDVEPLGVAILFGATAGVVLGGILGSFAVLIQVAIQWRKLSSAR